MNAILMKYQPMVANSWWKRASVAGFWFFLIKGLLWLLAPLALYLMS